MFEQTFKNFNINFNALNEGKTFSSGDPVTGHVTFDLTKKTKITALTMALTGGVHVHWSTGGGGRKRRRRRVHSAKLDFFNCNTQIMQEHGASDGNLQPGTHVYPFTCQLPQGDFPSTFRGVHGEIKYKLTVSVSRPWHMSKDFVTELNFVNSVDTSRPELRSPLSGFNQVVLCCLWCASSPITMSATAEKKAFTPGETVRILCKFNNPSSRTVTPRARLQQNQHYYTHNRQQRTHVAKQLASVTGQPIRANTTHVQAEMMLRIPASASLTISNCSLLVVDYVIEVSLCVPWFHDVVVLIPIVLCDTPVHTCAPPYQ